MRLLHIEAGLVLGLLLTLGAAGCGGDNENEGVATAGGTSTATESAGSDDRDAFLQYAQCMRENGVPDFPDPEVNEGGQMYFPVPDDIPDSVINAAEEECREYRPFGSEQEAPDPQRIEQLRQYSQCIRENGIPDWPDPQDDGSLSFDPNELGLSGADDPRLQAAEEACRQLQPTAPPGAVEGGNGG